jgi:hypothetical protein
LLFHAIAQGKNWRVCHLQELQKQGIFLLYIFSIFYGYFPGGLPVCRIASEIEKIRSYTRGTITATSNLSFLQNPNRIPETWQEEEPDTISSFPRTSVTPLFLVLNELIYMWREEFYCFSVDVRGFKKRADVPGLPTSRTNPTRIHDPPYDPMFLHVMVTFCQTVTDNLAYQLAISNRIKDVLLDQKATMLMIVIMCTGLNH